jgi:hypothetical protein
LVDALPTMAKFWSTAPTACLEKLIDELADCRTYDDLVHQYHKGAYQAFQGVLIDLIIEL